MPVAGTSASRPLHDHAAGEVAATVPDAARGARRGDEGLHSRYSRSSELERRASARRKSAARSGVRRSSGCRGAGGRCSACRLGRLRQCCGEVGDELCAVGAADAREGTSSRRTRGPSHRRCRSGPRGGVDRGRRRAVICANATSRPPRWPSPEAWTATQTPPCPPRGPPVGCRSHRVDDSSRPRVDPHDAGAELALTQRLPSLKLTRRGATRDRDRRRHRQRGRRRRARPCRRARSRPRASRRHRRFRSGLLRRSPCGHRVRLRVDFDDTSRRLVGHPDRAAADGDPATDRVRPDRLLDDVPGVGVDARHGAVVGVRHPNRAIAVCDGGRPAPTGIVFTTVFDCGLIHETVSSSWLATQTPAAARPRSRSGCCRP